MSMFVNLQFFILIFFFGICFGFFLSFLIILIVPVNLGFGVVNAGLQLQNVLRAANGMSSYVHGFAAISGSAGGTIFRENS